MKKCDKRLLIVVNASSFLECFDFITVTLLVGWHERARQKPVPLMPRDSDVKHGRRENRVNRRSPGKRRQMASVNDSSLQAGS